MPVVGVWLGGDGPSEIGDRDRKGARVGTIEALLTRIRATGWHVAGATQWRHIRKFKVGAARGRRNHGDIHNVAGLVNQAFEAGAGVVAFARDIDAEPSRVEAINLGIAFAMALFQDIEIIGGPAMPALEGWIVALLNIRGSDGMSRQRANETLEARDLGGKSAEAYVSVVESADLDRLPPGCDSLTEWLAKAREVLSRVAR